MRTYLFTAVFCLFALSVCLVGVAPASDQIVAYENSILWGLCFDVAVFGDYALYTKAYGLEIVDISDPANPNLVSQLLLENAHYIAISGTTAFVTMSYGGFYAIDITDPLSPAIIGTYAFGESTRSITVHNDIAYLGLNDEQIHLVSVVDPTNPILITTIYTQGCLGWIAFAGDYAFVAEVNYGLEVFDISTPSSPILVESYGGPEGDFEADYKDIAISGDYAFIIDYAYSVTSDPGGFQVLNISDPTDVYLVGIYDIHLLNSLILTGNTVFISTQSTGLYSFDVTDPLNPLLLDHDTSATYVNHLDLHNTHLLSSSRSNIIYDVADPAAIGVVFEDPLLSENRDLCLNGNYAYLAHRRSGMTVIDIADPVNPVMVANYPTTGWTHDVVVRDGLLYVSCAGGLLIYDLADPAAPAQIGFAADTDSSGLEEITLIGDYAYVTGCPLDMCIFDISNPAAPFLAAVYSPTPAVSYDKWVENVGVYGSYAYVTNMRTSEVFIVDVSDPTSPVEVGVYTCTYSPVRTSFISGYALVSGFHITDILDISDPVNPVPVRQMSFGTQNEMIVYGNYMFIPNELGSGGFYIYNITDFLNMYSLGLFETPDKVWGMAMAGNHLFIADWGAFLVMTLDLPTYRAGDANGDGLIDVGDAVYMINHVFREGAAPTPMEAGDANCDGEVNVGDAVALINYIFKDGVEPCYP